MDLKEQIKQHKELSQKIEELEEQKKAIGQGILKQMQTPSLKIEDFIVKRCTRISIKISLEQAKALSAIKIEETIDKDKIKSLYKNGQTIEGVSEIEYIQISQYKTFPSS